MTENTKPEDFKPKELAAIQLLSRDIPWSKVAEEVGVTIKTINQWHHNLAFSQMVDQGKREYWALKVQNVDSRMNALEGKAIEALGELLESTQNENTRLKAISLILNHQNNRKTTGEGQVMVNFNVPEPAMPAEESVEEGDTTGD